MQYGDIDINTPDKSNNVDTRKNYETNLHKIMCYWIFDKSTKKINDVPRSSYIDWLNKYKKCTLFIKKTRKKMIRKITPEISNYDVSEVTESEIPTLHRLKKNINRILKDICEHIL